MTRRLVSTCIALVLALAGCRAGPSDKDVAALARDLKASFPEQIAFTDWENAPPLDPPLIFVDFKRGLPDEEALNLLREQIKPRVLAVHPDIEVRAGGWSLSDNCP